MEVNSTAIRHLTKMSSSLNELRKSEDNCDFTIKVGDDSFSTHRSVLISSSDYFRGMFSHDTKERQTGVVEIKDIDSEAMRLCIDFMYTGNTDAVTMETANILLPASKIFQLSDLSKKCVKVLNDNLNSGNCIDIMKLAKAYDCSDLAENAEETFKGNFEMEDYGDFYDLDIEGIKQHISDYGLSSEVAWDGIINWVKVDPENRNITELVNVINWNIFPSAELLSAVWTEPMFKNSECCRKLLFKRLFLNIALLKKNTDVENCFVIDQIASEFTFLTEEAKKVILDFMKMNLMLIATHKQFLSLKKDKILFLLSGDEIGLCEETFRWNAARNWMKNNPESKDIFPEILKSIRFNRLLKILEKEVPYFEENPHLYKFVLNDIGRKSDEKTYVAVLYSDSKINAWNITDKTWQQLPDCPKTGDNTQMFSFRGKLCVLNDGELFYLGKNETEWIQRACLEHCLSKHAAVATTSDKIYIIESKKMSRYDAERDIWYERLPGCNLEGKFFAGNIESDIFVTNTAGKMCYFYPKQKVWGKKSVWKSEISANAAMASHDNEMYFVGIHSSTNYHGKQYCEAKHYKDGWKPINNTPVNVKDPSHLFFVDSRPILLVTANFYVYDGMCDMWMDLAKLPTYRARTLGYSNNLNPVRVCSFKGNLKDIPNIDITM